MSVLAMSDLPRELNMNKVGIASIDDYKNKRKKLSNNPLVVLFFYRTLELFWRGNKKDLEIEDLGDSVEADLSEPLGDELERNWYKEIAKAKEKGRKPKLWRALFRTFIWGYLIDGGLIFVQAALCKPFQAVMLSMLVGHFGPGGSTRQEACQHAGALVGLSLLAVCIHHHVALRQTQRGMRMRVACCSLLYRKILRLSSESLGHTTAGQVVNLMSNDVSRFDNVLIWLHYLWIMPFQISLICYLIYLQVDIAALVGVAAIVLQTLPVQSYLSHLTSKLRMKIAKRTDERVRLMNEIISGIQVIKMYAWEKPFEKVVSAAREHELMAVVNASYLRGMYMNFLMYTERVSLYVTLLAYSLLGNPIKASVVFSLAQFYNRLQETLAYYYPNTVSQGAECLVTCKRIEDVLTLPERDIREAGKSICEESYISKTEGIGNLAFEGDGLKKQIVPQKPPEELMDKDVCIFLKNVVACWGARPTLEDLSLTIPRGKLCAIIGSVGAGKSSFLQLLLRELPQKSGLLKINGTISYASQEPWLFVATVRNNILFGQPYDPDRFKEVVRVCALEADLQQFPHGDQTLVGERGTSLSGGQRARINLARAVYRQSDIYLLDDPLSAVDAPVGRHLYERCFVEYLAGKTRVLVTHQLHYLKAADLIIVLKDGQVENIGTYTELAVSGKQFSQLLFNQHEDTAVDDDEKARSRNDALHSTSNLSRSNKEDRPEQEHMEAEKELEEESEKAVVSVSMLWRYWGAAKNNSLFFFMLLAMVVGQLTAIACDCWVTFWSSQQSKIDIQNFNLEVQMEDGLYFFEPAANHSLHTDLTATRTTEFNIWDYIGPLTTAEYLYIYTATIVVCVFFATARSFVFFQCCMKSSKGLHDEMFRRMLRGTMRFFDTNSSGRILNRFSKDIGAIDEQLPRAYIDVFQILLVFIYVTGLVSATNPWLLLPNAFILLIFYLALRLYLNTALDLKRLETVHRSPVYSHLTATLNGIVTIRATGSQQNLIKEFDRFQDIHSLAWYQYLSCNCTLGFWLDTVYVIFIACVCFSFIFVNDGNVSSSNVGLAVSQTMTMMGMLQYGVWQMAEVVAQMTSVERVLQYTRIPEEPGLDHGVVETPENWPSSGSIKFSGATLSYCPDSPVLKDLYFQVKSGWKVGIVGRTGAGKSSLIAALFRLAPVEGDIFIDDVSTADITLQDVRSKISIIPQEPVLFSATVRYNLDPLEKYPDDHLWSALEAVELKEVITSLDQHVCEGGSNFSLGQRQLLCLARAILRNNQILVLDEATANVDPQTDSFIQKTIREKFSQCTVLTVAHRLNTVMDSDRVLVMDSGRVVEYDHPHKLLQNQNGHLYNMVRETGSNMTNMLTAVAKSAYEIAAGSSSDNGGSGDVATRFEEMKNSNKESIGHEIAESKVNTLPDICAAESDQG